MSSDSTFAASFFTLAFSTTLGLVVGFTFRSCDETLSNWLIVYGFMCPITFCLLLFLFCCALACMIMNYTNLVLKIGVLFIIILSSMFLWIIYGAILFLPFAIGPYPTCPDGKDGRFIVITGNIIIILCFIFTFNVVAKVRRIRRER